MVAVRPGTWTSFLDLHQHPGEANGPAGPRTLHARTHLEAADEGLADLGQVLRLQQALGDPARHQAAGQLPELVQDAGRLLVRRPRQDVVVELFLRVFFWSDLPHN